ncbi:helix-turn-helix transcriptional regulator [Oerskovia sp. Sa1BUA8]|uniref:Helix-turn-helix transcriptional regulator n=1 Tax=Oerskovia douganii TaxID=2762210 RepID=A0A9D5YXJ5_9CELL|nr:helix-turn-helix transcriptional regulator [Oerskovia douganii]MBE7699235.1 helix-turn-helix transcriptional regulator [Oerskovia douganii]
MGQEAGRDWAARWAKRIGENLAALRKERGVSARELSERCEGLGYPIPRSTIANIESGRKRELPVQELAVLAAALNLAPLALLYDSEHMQPVLPNKERTLGEALLWFSGEWLLREDEVAPDYDAWIRLDPSLIAPSNSQDGGIEARRGVAAAERQLGHRVAMRDLARQALHDRDASLDPDGGSSMYRHPSRSGADRQAWEAELDIREAHVASAARVLNAAREWARERGITVEAVPESIRPDYERYGHADA